MAARNVVDALKAKSGALLPVLHEVRETFGYIAPDVDPLTADALNISRAEVHGVVTFYADFRVAPPVSHELKLCRAEACQTMGADRLAERAAARIGIGEPTADHRNRSSAKILGTSAAGRNQIRSAKWRHGI
jgi:formate dehydrogenase subunit gamma